jgi:hypothetical protein
MHLGVVTSRAFLPCGAKSARKFVPSCRGHYAKYILCWMSDGGYCRLLPDPCTLKRNVFSNVSFCHHRQNIGRETNKTSRVGSPVLCTVRVKITDILIDVMGSCQEYSSYFYSSPFPAERVVDLVVAVKLDKNFRLVVLHNDRLCGPVVRVFGYRSGGPGSIPGTTRKKLMGLERGPLSLVSTTEELLDRKVAAPV